MTWLKPALLLVAAICLGFGLFLPIIRFDSFYFFSETPSLIELVVALAGQGDLLLALVVGLFSIAFPILKLTGIGLQLLGRGRQAGIVGRLMPHLSRWSMMDVMLVAIVVFAAKSSGVATAVSQPGLWFYAASAVIAGILPALGKASA